jgi:hypothetical protein
LSYKDLIKRSHPYDGDCPDGEKTVEEALPTMLGHDDTVENPQSDGSRWRDPMIVPNEPILPLTHEKE